MATPSVRLRKDASFANSPSSASASSTSQTSQRRISSKLARHVLAVSLLALVVLGGALPSWATTYTVTSTADSGTGSLRAALGMAANGDMINFNLTYPATITLTSGYLEVSTDVTITGPGAANLIISGGKTTQVFQVDSSVTGLGATISGVTIENGAFPFGGPSSQGGAIYNGGTMTVSDSTFSGNPASVQGGAIYNGGTMTVSDSTFSGNPASVQGGAIFNGGTLSVSNSTFSANSATAYGGAILNNIGGVTVSNSTFSGNSASQGGAIFNVGTVTVSFSTFSGNSATSGQGGAILNTDAFNTAATLTLKASLLAGQTGGGNCYNDGGSTTSDGYNLSDDSTCTFLTATGDQNDVTNAATYLGPLQSNGGPPPRPSRCSPTARPSTPFP